MNELSLSESSILSKLETTIERGLQTFVEVGEALADIRDKRLYRQNYDTFEDYCRERWGMSRRFANYQIEAMQIVKTLGTIVPKENLPQTESQARPLAPLAPDQQREVWQDVVDTAPNGNITASHVKNTVDSYNYKRDNRRSVAGDIYVPQGMDACQTPAYAIDPILPYLHMDWTIWEPACGENLMVDALYDANFDVVSGDILTGQNFFDYEPDNWDCLVTNPPYSIQFQWLERCYQFGKPFALLLKVEILGTKTAQEMFEKFGVEVIFVSPRINFKMPNKGWQGGGAQFPTAWFTWKLNIGKQMTFIRIKPDDNIIN